MKDAWKEAPAVFLGTVDVAAPDGDAQEVMFQEQSVRIRVVEAFKGVSQGDSIELHQAATDCSAKFRTGRRAVFYLYGEARKGWYMQPCSYSIGSAEPEGDDLLFLRGLPQSAIGTRLSGQVEYYQESPAAAFHRVSGIPKVRVTISGPVGIVRQIETNNAGVFEVFGMEPETYSVAIDVPLGKKIKFPVVLGSPHVAGTDAAVILGPDGGASVSFVLEDDTRLSGRVLDARGAPIRNVCVHLEPLSGAVDNGGRVSGCSDQTGKYEMTMMAPGTYRVVAHDDVYLGRFQSTSTLYYPGVRDRTQSTVISIEAGRYLEDVDIRLPVNEKRYQITGRLTYADGVPVDGAIVTFTSPSTGYIERTTTGTDGAFGLSVLAGVQGELTGDRGVLEPILKSCPEFTVGPDRSGMIRYLRAQPVALTIDSNRQGLALKLTSRSCKAWPTNRKR